MDHHAMLEGKTASSSTDNIITIMQWEKHHTPHLSEEQKHVMIPALFYPGEHEQVIHSGFW
jgi:hypothetical protein